MKNVFGNDTENTIFYKKTFIPAAAFILILLAALCAFELIGAKSEAEGLVAAKRAVRRAAVQCYALEGRYPPDAEYLRERYGLAVDLDKYVVHYRAFASNIMPEIDVFVIAPADAGIYGESGVRTHE